jgi:hypothetical protein
VSCTQLDDSLFAFEPNAQVLCHFNETAQTIWRRCDGDRSIADLIRELCEVFAADESVIREDILNCLQDWVECGWVDVA